ncbi:hypothetical protein [Croceivirga thetidis]|uniref:Lipocalin-like domain-containing protein n=1 Tax=Croceivirga thetidis TaxID=2721623 RepID=A0ABX1GT98_9FLAO|nr:hypothetical protein [Croceivirga thetidis]NKI33182.1 hypothetical protein [Croceivirga thetidis]
MKTFTPNFLRVFILSIVLLFASCQEEFEDIGGEEQETIEAGSTTANLIQNTSAQDGSFDNIVDEASCFAIQFPYTVEVAGIQITIDSIEDLRVIEELFDAFDTDEDIVDILFPITIVYADYTELVIESKEQLRELAEECIEGGGDDDIECIDFVYPITLFTFDVNSQVTGEVVINSDRELRRFFANLQEDDLVSLDYPVTLKKYDGTEIVVENNAELAMALEAAKDECDEDDDDDYNDDDFNEEHFVEYLTECPWKLRDIRRFGADQLGQYEGFMFDFNADGTVEVTGPAGNMSSGEWAFEFTPNGVLIELAFGDYVDFSATWLVYEIEEGKIKFYNDNDNRLILKRYCEDDHGDDNGGDNGDGGNDNGIISVETLINTLKECEWLIKDLELQNEDLDRLLGFGLIFGEEGMVVLSDGLTEIPGTYEVGANDEGHRTLSLTFEMEGALTFEWPLVEIDGESIVKTDWIKMYDETIGYKLIIEKICEDPEDGDVGEIRNIVMGGGLWNVAMYDDEGVNSTEDYADMDFGFSMFNQVEVSINDDPIANGVWRVVRDTEGNLVFYLNMGDSAPLGELTEPWYVTEVNTDRVMLVYEDEEVNFKTLVFEKKP